MRRASVALGFVVGGKAQERDGIHEEAQERDGIHEEAQERDGIHEEAQKVEAAEEYMKSRWAMAQKHASTRERARRYNQRYSEASSFFTKNTLQLLDKEEKESVLKDHGGALEEKAQPSSNANATQMAQAAQVDVQRAQQETQRRLEEVEVKVNAQVDAQRAQQETQQRLEEKLDRLLAHLKVPESLGFSKQLVASQ
jgi:hypothetical protein